MLELNEGPHPEAYYRTVCVSQAALQMQPRTCMNKTVVTSVGTDLMAGLVAKRLAQLLMLPTCQQQRERQGKGEALDDIQQEPGDKQGGCDGPEGLGRECHQGEGSQCQVAAVHVDITLLRNPPQCRWDHKHHKTDSRQPGTDGRDQHVLGTLPGIWNSVVLSATLSMPGNWASSVAYCRHEWQACTTMHTPPFRHFRLWPGEPAHVDECVAGNVLRQGHTLPSSAAG